MLLVSLLNPVSGAAGIVAALTAAVAGMALGFRREAIQSGLYGFNAVFLGLAIGNMYAPSPVMWVSLLFSAVLCVFLTVFFEGFLAKYGLPFLSLPFLASVWLVSLAAPALTKMPLSERGIFWLNDLYAYGDGALLAWYQRIEHLPLAESLLTYFRSMGTIFFQGNVLGGILVSVGLLYWSRIAWTLSLLGFYVAYGCYTFAGADLHQLDYFHLGFNFILTAVALGGFFLIPSRWSYLFVLVLMPIAVLLSLALQRAFAPWGLPVYSLPFTLATWIALYGLRARPFPRRLVQSPYTDVTPEVAVYRQQHANERYRFAHYLPISLPVWGKWFVSQGHDGETTHKGAWSKAWDFILLNEELRSYNREGNQLSDYYCYNKPVFAPADGWVEAVANHIEENAIGGVNMQENWGNSIVIRHAEGLYSQLSHLLQGSVRVAVGDFVRRGDLLATVGNSGRSPEPHLHFQLQATPYIGAATLSYPVGYFLSIISQKETLHNFEIPQEGTFVQNIEINPLLKQAFQWIPNMKWRLSGKECVCATDAYNRTYWQCVETGAVAYFVNNGTVCYFTEYYGSYQSPLWVVYCGLYKVLLSFQPNIPVEDEFPTHFAANSRAARWLMPLNDFFAPFFSLLRYRYRLTYRTQEGGFKSEKMHLRADTHTLLGGWMIATAQYDVYLQAGRIDKICITDTHHTITEIIYE